MKYHQKDIVEIDFPIPGEGYKVHPALIVSNDELQVDEGFVYVALISSQDFAYSRHYAYPLKDEMLSLNPCFFLCFSTLSVNDEIHYSLFHEFTLSALLYEKILTKYS